LSPTFKSFRVAGEAALFKFGLPSEFYGYRWDVVSTVDGFIGNAGDLAHYVLFISMGKRHCGQRKQQSSDCCRASHTSSPQFSALKKAKPEKR
jgi:hypothetical protein